MTAATMTRAERLADARTWAGYRTAAFARESGTLVVVVDGFAAGLEVDELLDACGERTPRWFTICDDHGSCVGHTTLVLARAHAANPTGWCENCREQDADA